MNKIFFLFLSVFVGCTSLPQKQSLTYHDLKLDMNSEQKVDESAPLTLDQIREDVNLLTYAISRAYGGASTHPESLFKSVDSELRELSSTQDIGSFCKSIAKTVLKIPDGHLNIFLNGKPCVRRKRDIKDVGTNLNQTKKNWSVFIKKAGTKNVLVIAISSFSPGTWPGFEKTIKKELETADTLIIDLRGNGGGDDTSGKLLADIVAGQDVNVPSGKSYQRQSRESLVIWQNYLQVIKGMIQKSNPTDKAAITSIDEYLAKADSDLMLATSNKLDEYKINSPENLASKLNEKVKFKGNIYILQDKKCFSSCESTIDFFEYFPNVTRVGDNTGGMIQFGNVGIFRLKNSGVMVQMPTKANTYKDNRSTELVGIKPDILLENGSNAYESVLKIISSR